MQLTAAYVHHTVTRELQKQADCSTWKGEGNPKWSKGLVPANHSPQGWALGSAEKEPFLWSERGMCWICSTTWNQGKLLGCKTRGGRTSLVFKDLVDGKELNIIKTFVLTWTNRFQFYWRYVSLVDLEMGKHLKTWKKTWSKSSSRPWPPEFHHTKLKKTLLVLVMIFSYRWASSWSVSEMNETTLIQSSWGSRICIIAFTKHAWQTWSLLQNAKLQIIKHINL